MFPHTGPVTLLAGDFKFRGPASLHAPCLLDRQMDVPVGEYFANGYTSLKKQKIVPTEGTYLDWWSQTKYLARIIEKLSGDTKLNHWTQENKLNILS